MNYKDYSIVWFTLIYFFLRGKNHLGVMATRRISKII